MVSVKKITTGEARELRIRRCRKESLSVVDIVNSDDEYEDAIDSDDQYPVENVKNRKKQVNPKVTHNAQDSELNFAKQYTVRFQACNRELVKLDKAKGSATKDKQKVVKLLFQTGMFEILKKKMIDVMQAHFNVQLTDNPKVELYGQSKAEERILIDAKFPDKEKKAEYNVKVTVYNTNCTMSFDSVGKGKKEIDKQSVAEYFVDNVVKEVVSILEKRYNVQAINEQYRQLAVLGLEQVKKGFHNCIECKKSVNIETNFTCHYCKKHIHESCLRKTIGCGFADKLALKKDAFNCQACLEMETPKMVENSTNTKMAEIANNVNTLLAIQHDQRSNTTEGEKNDSNLELEELSEQLSEDKSTEEKENETEKETNPTELDTNLDEAPKCNNCDVLKEERDDAVNMRTCYESCITTLKIKLQRSEEESAELKSNIVKLEDNLKSKSTKLDESIKTHEKTVENINENRDQIKTACAKLEDDLRAKNSELDALKKEHEKFVKDTNENSDDVNLQRLRKTHADLKKEVVKLSESHKKETESIKKDKKRLEEELRIATVDNRNRSDERTTMNDLFKCMKEFIEKNSNDMNDTPRNQPGNENGARREYSCTLCDYKGPNNDEFEKHKKDVHAVKYTCDICGEKFSSMDRLHEHKQKHSINCSKCIFRTNIKEEMDEHVQRRHNIQVKCTLCDFTTETKNKLSDHVKDFHKIKSFNCPKCHKSFNNHDDLKKHDTNEHGQKEHSSPSKKTFTQHERRANGFCSFWNHSTCRFGEFCRFAHEEAPPCRYQDSCRSKPRCQFYHEEQHKKNTFLGRNQEGWRSQRFH